MNPWILVATIFILNLPFGAWRATTRKFSIGWFISIHAPVIVAILLRLYSGIGWRPITFLESVAAFFLGQFLGGWLYRRCKRSLWPSMS